MTKRRRTAKTGLGQGLGPTIHKLTRTVRVISAVVGLIDNAVTLKTLGNSVPVTKTKLDSNSTIRLLKRAKQEL